MNNMILIGNFRGGVGKTFLSTSISEEYRNRGLKTLAVDTDPQANMYSWLSGQKAKKRGDYFKIDEHLTVLSSPIKEAGDLPKIKADNYDRIIIDTPPNADALTEIVLTWKPKIVLIPITARLSRDGAVEVMKIVKEVSPGSVVIGVLNNLPPVHTPFYQELCKKGREIGVKMHHSPIRHSTWAVRAEEEGVGLGKIRGKGRGREAFLTDLKALTETVELYYNGN